MKELIVSALFTSVVIFLAICCAGCIDSTEHEVTIPELPCLDGWQYDFIGQPIVDPYGAQIRCE